MYALIITACFLSAAGNNTRSHAEYAMVDFYRWGNANGRLEPVLLSLFYCGGEDADNGDTHATTCVCA